MKQENTVEFSNAVSQLTLQNIFFTALFYSMRIEQDTSIQTIATDGVRIIYNPEKFRSFYSAKERVNALVHELLHVILYHPLRRGIRDPELWNIACDYAVDLLMEEYGFNRDKQWSKNPKYKNMTAEQIYDLLMQEQQGGGSKPQIGPEGMDVLEYVPGAPGNDGVTKAEVERMIGISTEKALQAAKAAGQLPNGMKSKIEAAQVAREPWYQHLRRYFNSMHTRQYNWSRINTRRAVMFNIVSPDMRTESMGKIVAGIDESGSMSDRQRAAVATHLMHLCRECNPKSIVLIQFDSQVHRVTEYKGPEYDIAMERVCQGGTRFQPVFDTIMEDHSDAQVCMMFTDMEADLNLNPPSMDVLWVCDRMDAKPPFGITIYADFND